ncbi:MAG: DUF1330 domain-containing protein [Bryobacteraceae bacterium]|nr:DUF1330 domain-containing protein [Bryobacteraceae bacterium]
MAYETLNAVAVTDAGLYAQYRSAMIPLLEAAGGTFRFDCEVSRVLRGDVPDGINRVFVIRFPDRGAKEAFFADEEYRAIRARLFDRAVKAFQVIADYEIGEESL